MKGTLSRDAKKLTIGKLRGIQRISDKSGIFSILAIDHRESLMKMISPDNPKKAKERDLTEAKISLAKILGPLSSSILLDPIYGAPQAISQNIIKKDKGLLVSIESSGYRETKVKENGKSFDAKLSGILPMWGVEKIKRMGADAVKLVIYYRPDIEKISRLQESLVKNIAEDCKRHDILFLCEIVTYPKEPHETKSDFETKKPSLVIESARIIGKLGIDILKLEFPCSLNREGEKKAFEYCRKISDSIDVPWVLLSRGTEIDEYKKQLEIACRAGASGFACGRAIWQHAFEKNKSEREYYLKNQATKYLAELNAIAEKYAVPWHKKLEVKGNIDSVWYKKY